MQQSGMFIEEFDQKEFEKWCEQTETDPTEPGSREAYMDELKETAAETGDAFWNELSPEDRAGWEDNMNKD